MSSFFTIVVTAIAVAFSVIAHELAHGYMALREGDDTARRAGRLTWNPFAHVDLVLTGVLPVVTWLISGGAIILGGAKPMPVSPHRYRNGVESDILVSLAGVAANALIALACAAALPLAPWLGRVVLVNVALIVFNLLPIRPLDGWRVWRCIATQRATRARRACHR